MKEKFYNLLLDLLQNLMIYAHNKKAYKVRYGVKYHKYLSFFKQNRNL